MSTIDETLAPPLLVGLRGAVDLLASVADAAVDRCGTEDLLAALDAAKHITDCAAGLVATIVGEVDDRGLAAELGAGSTRALLRHRYRLDPHVAKAWDRHAFAVCNVFPVIAAGQRDGLVSAEQARVILAGLDKLPHTSTAKDREWAQHRLVAQCSALEPKELVGEATKAVEELTLVSEDGPEPADPAEPDPYDKRTFTTRQKDGGVEVRAFSPAWTAPNWKPCSACAPATTTRPTANRRTAGRTSARPMSAITTRSARRCCTRPAASTTPARPLRRSSSVCAWRILLPGWPGAGWSTWTSRCRQPTPGRRRAMPG